MVVDVMKKFIGIIILCIVLIWAGIGVILWNTMSDNIPPEAALNIALDDVSNEVPQVYDIDIDYERTYNGGIYEISFNILQLGECVYIIDAKTGDILNSTVGIYDD